jgi:hypothetical protein
MVRLGATGCQRSVRAAGRRPARVLPARRITLALVSHETVNARGNAIPSWRPALRALVEEPDAESIRRERERRRAEERTRIDRDRGERELELARLRRANLLQSIEERRGDRRGDSCDPLFIRVPGNPSSGSRVTEEVPRRVEHVQGVRPGGAASRARGGEYGGSTDRSIGRPVHSPALRQLMALDPAEKFDIQLLNSITLPGLVAEVSGDARLLESLKVRSEALMARVKTEVDDPLSAGAFLREQVLLWYRRSPREPEWATRMPERWAGLFTDSRVTGGKLHAWLNTRLRAVYEGALRQGRLSSRIRRGLRHSRVIEAAMARSAHQQIQAESAQALLDDLAAAPRDGEEPFPLVRMSELAVRRQVQTVNDALSLLFNSRESGPFIVLHPNRYPDCNEVQIRPPAPAATGAALAYLLVNSRSLRRSGGRSSAASSSGGSERRSGAAGEDPDEEAYDGTSIWESNAVRATAWRELVEGYRQERKRLETPPKDHRVRPAYAALRDILLEDVEFRKGFLAVRWRGRPAGLPLLVQLLQKGTLKPDVSTDHEYLEAELGSLAADDPEWHPEGGTWTFRNWTVTREEDANEGTRYTAQRSPDASSSAPP